MNMTYTIKKYTFATVQYSNQEIQEIEKLQKTKHTLQFTMC